jgi:hypothetical protein
MDSLIQVLAAIVLIAAWLAALRYLVKYWPNLRNDTTHIYRRFSDEIRNVFPDLHFQLGRMARRLHNEIRRLYPVFSAETTQNREAEFIRDRLPESLPWWLALLAIVAVAGLAWWITK